jgi:HEAT repeat protein
VGFCYFKGIIFCPNVEDFAMIRFSCPDCETNLKAPEEKAGTLLTCPECRAKVEVPSEAPAAKTKGKKDRPGVAPVRHIIGAVILVGVLAALGIVIKIKYFTEEKTDSSGTVAKNDDGLNKPINPRIIGPVDTRLQPASVSGPGVKPTPPDFNPNPGPAPIVPPSNPSTPPPVVPKPPDTGLPPKPNDPPKGNEVSRTGDPSGEIKISSLTGEDARNRLLKSIAWIVTEMPEGTVSGSGSLVDKQNRLVLTNHHVVSLAHKGKMRVFFPDYEKGELVKHQDHYMKLLRKGEGIPCHVVYQDMKKDLALIKLPAIPDEIAELPIAKNSPPEGSSLHTMGCPGLSNSLWVYSPGTVRSVFPDKWNLRGNDPKDPLVTVEAMVIHAFSSVGPGDSGGPTINDRKELVAVTQGGRVSLGNTPICVFIDVTEIRKVLNACYKANTDLKRPPEIDLAQEDNKDIPNLMKALQDSDLLKRANSARVLGRIGPSAKPALPALLKVLKDPDDTVRKYAMDAILQIGSLTQVHLPPIIEAVKDKNMEVRLSAIGAIKIMGGEAETAVPALIAALKDPERDVRQKAANALAKMGTVGKTAVPALAETLTTDQSAEVRAEAAYALSRMGQEAVPALKSIGEGLKHNNRDVRVNSLNAIAAMGSEAKELLPQLEKPLKERDKDTRLAAIEAVGSMGPDAAVAVPNLIDLLEEKDFREASKNALVKIGKPAIDELIKALTHPKKDVRAAVAQALGDFGTDAKRALPALDRRARVDPDMEVKKQAQTAIRRISGK